MKRILALALFVCLGSSCFAQLTPEQKQVDFMALAGLYDKNYGPYQWKIQAFGYDLLNLAPWLAEVNASTDDLSFYDVCVRYVASLNDFHDEYILPSSYEAFLPFTADIYDGKVLVDSIDTSALDPKVYTFQVGDELVSVNGASVGDLITQLAPYAVNGRGNPVSTNRLAVATILDRFQGYYTYASDIKPGDIATVEIKSSGKIKSYAIPWGFFGIPLTSEGPVPDPATMSPTTPLQAAGGEKRLHRNLRERFRFEQNRWGVWAGAPAPPEVRSVPGYMAPLEKLHNMSYAKPGHELAGGLSPFDSMMPLFNTPAGYQPRLGSAATDEFLSGTFPAGKATIGFIRIPSFEPMSIRNALQQFQTEMTFFEQNTSGLVIDVMANGGGNGCYTNDLMQSLFSKSFRSLGFDLRATEYWLQVFENSLINAEIAGDLIATKLYTNYIQEIQQALAVNRGNTGQVPLCTDSLTYLPAKDDKGKHIGYTRPILVLTDNFTGSAAEIFSATLQDNHRATVYGVRTSGGGGNVVEFAKNATSYSEGTARVTLSLARRTTTITTAGLPSASLIENIGVQPDVLADYQTKDNLLHGGQTFVNGFIKVISDLIATGKP